MSIVSTLRYAVSVCFMFCSIVEIGMQDMVCFANKMRPMGTSPDIPRHPLCDIPNIDRHRVHGPPPGRRRRRPPFFEVGRRPSLKER